MVYNAESIASINNEAIIYQVSLSDSAVVYAFGSEWSALPIFSSCCADWECCSARREKQLMRKTGGSLTLLSPRSTQNSIQNPPVHSQGPSPALPSIYVWSSSHFNLCRALRSSSTIHLTVALSTSASRGAGLTLEFSPFWNIGSLLFFESHFRKKSFQ